MIAADGLLWHVEMMGQGPVILLIHGTAASTHSWRDVVPLLATSYQVVALDLPGHGKTEAQDRQHFSLEAMARGVGAVMAELKLAPQIVAGHSAGAAILAEACARGLMAPERYVSFNGAFYPYGGAAGNIFSPVARLLAFSGVVPLLLSTLASRAQVERLLKDTGSNLTVEGVDHYFSLFKQQAHVRAALAMMASWDLSRMEAVFPRLKPHCVFVAGDQDKAVPPDTADRAARLCKDAEVIHVPGRGHLLHEEDPERAAELIAPLRQA